MFRRSHLSPVPSNQPGHGARPGAPAAAGFPGRYRPAVLFAIAMSWAVVNGGSALTEQMSPS